MNIPLHTSLTAEQKLQALALRFYQCTPWVPEAGHYYTSTRADLELYRIVKIENGKVYTEYTTNPGTLSEWDAPEFLSRGFGLNRIWVPDFILHMQ